MAMVLGSLVLLLATAGCSNGELYCMCKDGVSQASLLMAMDFACDAGADCSAIFQNEACLHPITLKNLCDLAINSYFQITGNCDVNGTATTSHTDPTTSPSHACAFKSPGPVAGRDRGHYWGITAQPPYYRWHGFGPGIEIGPETGGATPALSRHWCFKPLLICLTAGFLIFILSSISLLLLRT